jgi:hypothetical protein
VKERELEAIAETKPRLSQLIRERQAETSEAQSAPLRRHDPLAQVTCRIGDASCARAHVSTLNRATASQPIRGARSLLQLQRQYGNRYVQRVVAPARQTGGKAKTT